MPSQQILYEFDKILGIKNSKKTQLVAKPRKTLQHLACAFSTKKYMILLQF
jgi:hypothetical protein